MHHAPSARGTDTRRKASRSGTARLLTRGLRERFSANRVKRESPPKGACGEAAMGARERSSGARGATGDVREWKEAREAISSRLKTSPEGDRRMREVGHVRSAFQGAKRRCIAFRSLEVDGGESLHPLPRTLPARTGHETRRSSAEERRSNAAQWKRVGASRLLGEAHIRMITVERRNSSPHGAGL